MLRVLTLATLFPNRVQPTLGVFLERQTLGLAAHPEVELEVVAPLGLAPWPLRLHPHYHRLTELPQREIWKGLMVHRPRFRVLPRWGQSLTAASLARALLPRLRIMRDRFPFDVIDTEFFWPDGPAAVLIGRELGVPVSIKARGSDIHFWGLRGRIGPQIIAAGGAADGILAVSHALKAQMVALGMPASKIRVHYTGVDIDRFRPLNRAEVKRGLGIDGPLVVTAGGLTPRKRQALAIEAMALVPEATLLVVGDGPERARLEALAASTGAKVRFLGARPHEEVPRLIGGADILLHPSEAEGLANVWVEALACGTPVVAANIPGAREVITDDIAGRLVDSAPQDMAAAIRGLLDDPPDPERVRRSAEPFSWERNREELFDHLSGLVT